MSIQAITQSRALLHHPNSSAAYGMLYNLNSSQETRLSKKHEVVNLIHLPFEVQSVAADTYFTSAPRKTRGENRNDGIKQTQEATILSKNATPVLIQPLYS